jgi:hypothetical protein
MADDTQMILEQDALRFQMEDSRTALAQKIELLEEKVTETVASATASVAEATASVVETVQNATASVSQTVDSVTNAVQGTVDSVRHSVEGTVDSVRGAFNPVAHVQKHPWLMLAGAFAAGYIASRFLPEDGPSRAVAGARTMDNPGDSFVGRDGRIEPSRPISFASSAELSGVSPSDPTEESYAGHSAAPTPPSDGPADWTNGVSRTFAAEIAKLKGLAIGTTMSLVRDMITPSVPEALRQPVAEIIDDINAKLGGERICGALLPGSRSHCE